MPHLSNLNWNMTFFMFFFFMFLFFILSKKKMIFNNF